MCSHQRRRFWGEKVESFNEFVECLPVRETSSSDSDVLLETKVLNLMHDIARIVLRGRFVVIGLDSSDVGRRSLHQSRYQIIGRRLDLVACSGRSALVILIDLMRK